MDNCDKENMYKDTNSFAEHAYGMHLHNEDEARWMELQDKVVTPTPVPHDVYWTIMIVAVVSIIVSLIIWG